jgi:hypothetical protein
MKSAKQSFSIALREGESVEAVTERLHSDVEKQKAVEQKKAKYKIEVMFSRHRSPRADRESPGGLFLWESGKRLHGGGDQKMYWCGYDECGMPFSSDNFGYMHAVCPYCKREMMLDPDSRKTQLDYIRHNNLQMKNLDKLPFVVGEKFFSLTPPNLAALLEKTWIQLGGLADVYLKYSPFEIRYDVTDDSVKVIDDLNRARVQRQPLIYSLERILKDTAAGADLKGRFLAMITA